MMQYYHDQGEYAPQGLFGSLLGMAAPAIGGAIGGRFGNAALGRQIGSTAGMFSHFLPFNAVAELPAEAYAPQMAGDYAPQGMFGNIFGSIAPTLGGAIGGAFGQPNLGRQIGGIAGQLGRRFIPFSAPQELPAEYYGAPEYAPQGMFGNIFGNIAPALGGAIGGAFGQPNLGRQIGGVAGQLGRRFIPFGAEAELPQEAYLPMMAGDYAPQGAIGNLFGRVAPTLGGWVGGRFGQPDLGRQLGGIAGQLGQRFIPFGAEGGLPAEYAPQGMFGNLFGSIAPALGGAIGGAFGQPNLGRQIGGVAGQLGRRFIPFGATPELPAGYYAYA